MKKNYEKTYIVFIAYVLHFGAVNDHGDDDDDDHDDDNDDDDDDMCLPPSVERFFRRLEAPERSAASSADFLTGLMLQMVTAGNTSCCS